MKKFLLNLAALVVSASAAIAQTTLLSDNFTTGYTNGNLIGPLNTTAGTAGQNGWTQTGNFTSGNPIGISNGQAVLPSGAVGQDGWKAFSSAVDTTVSGDYLLTRIRFSLTNVPSTTGDYFFHLSSPTNTTSNFYQRLFARSATGGFQLGVSPTGAASTASFGSTILSLNTTYEAVLKWDFVDGSSNDLITMFVDPTDPIITNNTIYTSVTWSNAEPATLEAANLRIGGSTSTPGALVDSIEIAVVPEPSTYALLAVSGLALAGYAARRRQRD
jgi:hypothetical protein